MKPNKFLLLFLSLYIVNCTLYITYATVRYVSKTGSSTPPYTSWETAADSIQKCINISQFGDTIYVANGVYKEQVIMIPGLSLIGEKTDSSIIDTRDLITSISTESVVVADSCLFMRFSILVYYNWEMGRGVNAAIGTGTNSIIDNRIIGGSRGITPGLNTIVYNNSFENIRLGVRLFNSSAIIRKNKIIIDPNAQESLAAIDIEAFDFTYKPIIDSNYIETISRGINKSFGSRPTIAFNSIIMKPAQSGIFLSISDSANVHNNLIISKSGGDGIDNAGVQFLQLYNNYINQIGTGIITGPDIVKNNVVTNANTGVRTQSTGTIFQYNNLWNNGINYNGFIPDSTNLSVDPMIVNDDSTLGELDFHLQNYSPLINTGDPAMIDKDSSRIDIGLFGGLFGEVYTYLDLAPRPPRNVIAVLDTPMITVKWNRNTEADFSEYKLFRDTVADFIADSTTLVLSLTDTSYSHLTPPDVEAYYYKLTAVDNQGNESGVSEEIAVKLTSIDEYPMIVSDYLLYQNYPNPFNPSTTIAYKLKERGYVKLYVYDIKGELISVLVNREQEAGYYEVEFATNNKLLTTNKLASGVYIYQLIVKSESNIPVFSDIKKMLMIK